MVPTPTSQDHIERQNTNKTPSTGKLNYETNKSVSLDRWVKMWPTPTASEGTGAQKNTGRTGGSSLREAVEMWPTPTGQDNPQVRGVGKTIGTKRGTTLGGAVRMWQTPVADDSVDRAKGKWDSRGEPKLSAQVKLWPTPTKQDASNNGGPSQHKRNSLPLNTAVLYPTPSVQEPGWKNLEIVDKDGNPPTHANQRFYDKKTGRVVQKGLQQVVTDPKSGGKLNPQWVAWLMGYPTEYLNSVPWETRSSRRSRKK
jgi:hypothetical protein